MTSQTRSDPELWNEQIDWLLNCSAAAMGSRGTMGSVISAIERGGVSSNGDYPHDGMLLAIGWEVPERLPGECKPGARTHRNIDRAKRLADRWAQLSHRSSAVLAIHYSARPGGADSRNVDQSYATRSLVEQYLGACAAVALYLAEDPRKLMQACDAQASAKTRQAAKKAAEKAAEKASKAADAAVRAAHREWQQLGRHESPVEEVLPLTRKQEQRERVMAFCQEMDP